MLRKTTPTKTKYKDLFPSLGTSNKNSTREATTAEGGARTSIHGCGCREDGTLGARLLHHYAKTDFYKDCYW
jgi:hypothetical protein